MTKSAGAVLFDLDGTLVDTAPDMVRLLDAMIVDHGADPVPYPVSRSTVSNGSLGLVRLAFPGASEARHRQLQQEYLARFANEACENSPVFPGLDRLLDALDAARVPWGIVTNKPANLTHTLLDTLRLTGRAATVVCGDTLAERKPHPAPLLLAAQETGVAAKHCIYVGDARRDIEAGRAAGMHTVAAAFGYIVDGDDIEHWGADEIAADTAALVTIVSKRVNLPADGSADFPD